MALVLQTLDPNSNLNRAVAAVIRLPWNPYTRAPIQYDVRDVLSNNAIGKRENPAGFGERTTRLSNADCMITGNEMLILSGGVLFVTVIAAAARQAVWQIVRKPAAGSVPATLTQTVQLRPTELAYLLRDGDMAHTLIVLSADLVQRAVKDMHSVNPSALTPYEKQVWTSVQDFVKQWAEAKAGHLIPVNDIKNPAKWLPRINAIKRFFGETLKTFINDLIKDPRNIRKYFSIAGIGRLAVQLYASSVRGAVERELRAELMRMDMLVPEARRKKGASLMLATIPVMVAAMFGAAFLIQGVNMLAFACFLIFGFFNAILLRLVWELPGFIPTYDEFARVAKELNRSGFRLNAVRAILRSAKLIVRVVTAALAAILIAIQCGIAAGFLHISPAQAVAVIGTCTAAGWVAVSLALDWHSLTFHEHCTELGEAQIKAAKTALAKESPLQHLTQVFSNPDYDPTFSQLVAFYGIETLWLLS